MADPTPGLVRNRARALLLVFLAGGVVGCGELLVGDSFEFGRVEVTAERRWGAGVEGVELILFTGSRHLDFGTTDAEGRAVFEHVPFGIMGVSTTLPEGFRPLDLSGGWVQTFRQGDGERTEVSFTLLLEEPGDLEVRVEDPDGAPIGGVRMEVYSPAGVEAEHVSDATGERLFQDLPFGHYGVRALPGRGYRVDGHYTAVDGFIVEGGWTERALMVLERCLGQLRARAETGDGSPLAQVPITLYAADGDVDTLPTDAEGRAAFTDVPCGNYGVRTVGLLGYRLVEPAAGFVDGLVLEHQGTLEARFVFERCTGQVRVTARDGDGAPVPGVRLVLYASEGNLAIDHTGQDGRFTFEDVPCGEGRAVGIEAPEGFTVAEGPGSSYIDGLTVGPGDVLNLSFTLERL